MGGFDIIRQQREFSELIGRPVDLGTPQSLNPYIRQEVIESAQPIYDVDGIDPSRSKPMPKKPDKDRLRLLDMRDAAEKARRFAKRRTRAEIEDDEMLQSALVREVMVHWRSREPCQRRNEGAGPGYRLGRYGRHAQ